MAGPEFWLVAGPNGAGKTTCVQMEPISQLLPAVTFLNPDYRTLEKLRALGYQGFADAPPDVTDEYQCGELKLETVVGGKVIRAASLSDVETFLQDDKASREKPSCEVPSSGPANAFHAALTGTATRYGCAAGEYYFEDLSVWLYELGEMDTEKQQYILPGPGYHFESVADGDSAGKITTTYETFSWTDRN